MSRIARKAFAEAVREDDTGIAVPGVDGNRHALEAAVGDCLLAPARRSVRCAHVPAEAASHGALLEARRREEVVVGLRECPARAEGRCWAPGECLGGDAGVCPQVTPPRGGAGVCPQVTPPR